MKRIQMKKLFGVTGPVVLPVIHVLNREQAKANVDIALDAGCPGVFLINHDFPYGQLLPLICFIREKFPTEWMGGCGIGDRIGNWFLLLLFFF